jgi:hypothetical protein
MAQDSATRRRAFLAGAAVLILAPAGTYALLRRRFPSDRTAEGAYLRIARSVAEDDPRNFFAYIEQEAQWACFTLRDARKSAREKIAAAYPEPERTRLLTEHAAVATAPDGSDVFAHLYRSRGWSRRLRKDLSGVARVDHEGDRASVVTVRGTRYPFRRRDNGIWGLTIFTAELVADAEKATRDLAVVETAAADYARLKPATVIP